jgi:hypothetical protein
MARHTSDAVLMVMAALSFAFVVVVSFQGSKQPIEPVSIQVASKPVAK